MLLSEVILGLTAGVGEGRSYGVAVLCRRRVGPEGDWDEIESFAVLDVTIDEQDRNIDLLTDEKAANPVGPSGVLTAEGLLHKLRILEGRCNDWSVYSKSSRISVNPEWDFQMDMPLVGTATNHEDRIIGLLQGPDEQWRHAV